MPQPEPFLIEVAIGMILGDATMAKVSKDAYIKFEQGYKQKDFLYHLFGLFKEYSFMQEPRVRFLKIDENIQHKQVKSYLLV